MYVHHRMLLAGAILQMSAEHRYLESLIVDQVYSRQIESIRLKTFIGQLMKAITARENVRHARMGVFTLDMFRGGTHFAIKTLLCVGWVDDDPQSMGNLVVESLYFGQV